MTTSYSIKGSIDINASPEKVWNVLTNPDKIVLYIGSNITTDWKVGSRIIWDGEFGETKFQNKGKVLENRPDELLKFTYWSGLGGDADVEENYSTITYKLGKSVSGKITFIYTRENIPTLQEKTMFEQHLSSMLGEIKRLAEE